MEPSEKAKASSVLREAAGRFAPSASTIRVHKEALSGAPLPPPREVKRPSFTHGALLPISLMAAALRDPQVRKTYVRLVLVRAALVVAGAILLSGGDNVPKRRPRPEIELHAGEPVDAQLMPGVRLRLPARDGGIAPAGLSISTDGGIANTDVSLRAHGDLASPTKPLSSAEVKEIGAGELRVFGVRVPLNEPLDGTKDSEATNEKSTFWTWVTKSWTRFLAFLGALSFWEVVIVFFSRRWDDTLSYALSKKAGIMPEEPGPPPPPKVSADVSWAWRKVKRKIRGTLVFVAGFPVLLPLKIIPVVGDVAFTVLATLWGWYWIGVFAASKSAHAWVDPDVANPPLPIRKVRDATPGHRLFGPVRLYVRIWEWVTRETYPAVTTFERSPRAYLGLGLTRAVFSIPFLYLMLRPVLPVAAGRICAESDPADRFTDREPPPGNALETSPIDSPPS